jgi:hypothetical protein
LGDRRWRELLDRYDVMVAAEVERFRGRLIKDNRRWCALATFDGLPVRQLDACSHPVRTHSALPQCS